MKKQTLLALTVLVTLCTTPILAAPRIESEVTSTPEATLTPAEERSISVAAGRFLRHAYNARKATQAGDADKARAEIGQAKKLLNIIENALPSYVVTSRITSGDLTYSNEEKVKPTLIPIFEELDKVSLMAPLRQARSEKTQPNKDSGTEVIAADDLDAVEASLDLGLATDALALADEKLSSGDLVATDQALAAVLGSLVFSAVEVDLPLENARDNLMLAKSAIQADNREEAKAALAQTENELDRYAGEATKSEKKDIARLRTEVDALYAKLDSGKDSKGAVAHIEDWWDRIGKWIKK